MPLIGMIAHAKLKLRQLTLNVKNIDDKSYQSSAQAQDRLVKGVAPALLSYLIKKNGNFPFTKN